MFLLRMTLGVIFIFSDRRRVLPFLQGWIFFCGILVLFRGPHSRKRSCRRPSPACRGRGIPAPAWDRHAASMKRYTRRTSSLVPRSGRVHERGDGGARSRWRWRSPNTSPAAAETVLDVGCGEGAWFAQLRKARPNTRMPSRLGDYAVAQYGESRNIQRGTFVVSPAYDREANSTVVCSDVLHYLDEAEIQRGLPELVLRTGGVAFLEVLTKDDDIIGDLEGLIRRPAKWYRRLFTSAGLTAVGPYCSLSPGLRGEAAELATPSPGGRGQAL